MQSHGGKFAHRDTTKKFTQNISATRYYLRCEIEILSRIEVLLLYFAANRQCSRYCTGLKLESIFANKSKDKKLVPRKTSVDNFPIYTRSVASLVICLRFSSISMFERILKRTCPKQTLEKSCR